MKSSVLIGLFLLDSNSSLMADTFPLSSQSFRYCAKTILNLTRSQCGGDASTLRMIKWKSGGQSLSVQPLFRAPGSVP